VPELISQDTLTQSGVVVPREHPSSASMSLSGKVAGSAASEIFGFAASLSVRLAANLILTRMLFPEAFGLMAMVQVVLYGLTMLSDVGIWQGVVTSPRGGESSFLNTAWTMLVLRGLALWACACALTYPIALAFDELQLLWILPATCASIAIHGFASTRVFTLRRRLRLLPLQFLEIGAQVINVGVCLAGAWLGYGVGALVAGHLVSSTVHMLASHFLPGTSHRNAFQLEPRARAELFQFGRWIFLSSALTFLAIRADQLLLGRWLGASLMGVYNIGQTLADLCDTLATRLTNGVIYPMLARVHTQRPAELADAYYKVRLWFDLLLFTGLGGFAAMSEWSIALLYDERYAAAAEVMQILTFRAAVAALATLCEVCFVAQGASIYSFRYNLFVTIAMIVAMPVGGYFWGVSGLLWATVIARATGLLALWPRAHRHGFLRPARELLAVAYLACGYALGWLAVQVLPEVS
jgi:O-antigen/teichoic acid export membrane protein